MTRLLVVDDEPHLLRALVLNLTSRGYEVSTATTAAVALAQIRRLPPDVVLLDLGLPDLDGLDVLRELHANGPSMPMIVLSARTASQDKVMAFDLGAVDYVTKPFDMSELVARVRAVIRRSSTGVGTAPVAFGDVEVDLKTRSVRRASATDDDEAARIHLTPTEWRILEVLIHHAGRLVTSRELLTAVRGDPDHTERSYLRIYMAQLRRKLEPAPDRPRHLLTEPGVGYRFQP